MLQYLVRHGESVSNLEGRVQGQADIELSPLDGIARILARDAIRIPVLNPSLLDP